MKKQNVIINIFAISLIVFPFLHLLLISFLSKEIQIQINNFIVLFLNYINIFIKMGNIHIFLWLIELIVFIFLGFRLILIKKQAIQISITVILLFIILNILTIFIFKTSNYLLYLLPLGICIYALIFILIITLKSIRFSSFFNYKNSLFKPYFRHITHIDAKIKKDEKYIEGKIVNLSIMGCQIYSNVFLNNNDRINLNFNIENEQVNFNGIIVRVLPPKASFLTGFGVKFLKSEKRSKKHLKEYLQKSKGINLAKLNFKELDISFFIIDEENIIKFNIFQIDKNRAYLLSNNPKFKISEKINAKIKIEKTDYNLDCTVINVSDLKDTDMPQGFEVKFNIYNENFINHLEKILL